MANESTKSLQKYSDKKLKLYKETNKTALKVLNAQIKLADKVSLRRHKEEMEAYRVEAAAIAAQRTVAIKELEEKTKIADIEAKKEIKIVKMILENEEKKYKLDKQCEILSKMLEVAQDAFNKKIEYFDALSQRAQDFFEPQIAAIEDDIKALQSQQEEATDNPKLIFYITKQISEFQKIRNEINIEYKKLQSDLIKAVDLAKLEAPGQKVISGYTSNIGLIK